MGYKVVVVGATGNVGREMLNILAERQFPVDEVVALASSRSLGTELSLWRQDAEDTDLDTLISQAGTSRCLPSGRTRPRTMRRKPARRAAVVIDNSSLYRYDPEVPLIVPEVNPDASMGYAKKNIIANPNCSTAQMVVALKPLHDRATIKRVVVSALTSQCPAPARMGMDELWDQTKGDLRTGSGS